MTILQDDIWDLFSFTVRKNANDWETKFIGSSPMIFCNLSYSDFREKLNGTLFDKLVKLQLDEEIIHYRQTLSLIPTQICYWAYLFSFMQIHWIVTKNKEEELHLDSKDFGSSFLPPSLLGDDITLPLGNIKLDYKLILEGLALAEQLTDRYVSPELKVLYMCLYSINEDKIKENITHIQGFNIVYALMKYIKKEDFHPIFIKEDFYPILLNIFKFINYFPLFESEYRLMLKTFFSDNYEFTIEQRMSLCKEILMKGLHSFRELFRELFKDRGLVQEVLKNEEEMQRFLFRLLSNMPNVFFERWEISSKDLYYIPKTIALTSGILTNGFLYTFGGGREIVSFAQFAQKTGIFLVPVVFSDGTLVSFDEILPEIMRTEREYMIGIYTWIRFMFLEELLRWIVKGGNLSCPFYSFFLKNFGDEKGKIPEKFCFYFCSKSVVATKGSLSESHCTSEGSILAIKEISEKGNDQCFFWQSIQQIFKKFKKVRRFD